MAESNVERFRSEAKQCRQLAERATNAIDMEAWLRLAEDWIKLAEETEKKRSALWQQMESTSQMKEAAD